MTKSEREYFQRMKNFEVEQIVSTVTAWNALGDFRVWEKFRNCQATVSVNRYGLHVLKSYNIIVAAYDEETNTGYDFLRCVYGYTATSAQHIAKFFKQYQPETIYTWRNV